MRSSSLSRHLALAIVALLPATGLVAQPVTKAQSADTTHPKTVAILYFDNNTGRADYDGLGRGLSAMLITDLAVVPEIKLVERDRLQNVLAEQQLQQLSMFDPATAVRTGKLLGAEYLLTGAFSAVDPQMRIDTRVIRVETGEIVQTAKVQGKSDDFYSLQKKLAHELVSALPIAVSPESMQALEAQQERDRVADAHTILDVAAGLVLFDAHDYVGAVEKLAPALARSHDALFVQTTYDEAKRRAAATAKATAREKVKAGLRGLFKKP